MQIGRRLVRIIRCIEFIGLCLLGWLQGLLRPLSLLIDGDVPSIRGLFQSSIGELFQPLGLLLSSSVLILCLPRDDLPRCNQLIGTRWLLIPHRRRLLVLRLLISSQRLIPVLVQQLRRGRFRGREHQRGRGFGCDDLFQRPNV